MYVANLEVPHDCVVEVIVLLLLLLMAMPLPEVVDNKVGSLLLQAKNPVSVEMK